MNNETSHEVMLPWQDLSMTTAETTPTIKPINILRADLVNPLYVPVGCQAHFEIIQHEKGKETRHIESGPLPVTRTMTVDHVVKFELIDEFGMDVGLGFIMGQSKK